MTWRKIQKPLSDELHARVAQHIHKYTTSPSELTLEKIDKKKPTSLGIFLGAFDSPFTEAQNRAVSGLDIIILDALQAGISKAVGELQHIPNKPSFIVGRLDLNIIISKALPLKRDSEQYFLHHLDRVLSVTSKQFRDADGRRNGFTGILLVGWDMFPTRILHELTDVLGSMGLEVFLETSAPNFLEDSSVVASESICGVVIRNALLQSNGERQDCFDMDALKTTVKSFVSQACVRDFYTLVWETVDDDVVVSTAVLKRTYNWCNFYNVIPWIGPHRALFGATSEVVPFEPLSAFAWLKEPRIMELHELWKNKRTVSTHNL